MFARFAEAFNPAVAVSRNVWRRTQPVFRRRAGKFWPSSQRDKLEPHACVACGLPLLADRPSLATKGKDQLD
jgi:hypothetical protein